MANNNITKDAIRRAFLEILKEKPYKKITVRDISDKCGINRNTFYYHYQDIPALLEEIFEEAVVHIIEKYPELNSVEDCVTAVMEFCLQNKRAIMHIYDSGSSSTCIKSLWRISEYAVIKYIDTLFPDAPIADEDRKLWIRLLKCTLFGMISDWVESGMKEEEVHIIRRLYVQVRGVSDTIMQNYIDNFIPIEE